jgi:hypothetical protein
MALLQILLNVQQTPANYARAMRKVRIGSYPLQTSRKDRDEVESFFFKATFTGLD